MTKTTLKKLRLVIPGVITLIVFFFLLPSSFRVQDLSQFLLSLTGLGYLVIVCAIGGLYNIIGVRGLFLGDSLLLIQANIKQKLTVPFYAEDPIRAKIESLTEGRQLMNVFYRIIDNDESLKSKSQDVYFNGLLWSTTADVMALTSFAIPVYLMAYLFNPLSHYPLMALVLSVIYLFAALFLMPKVTSKHIELSNDQLDFILQHHRDELHKQLLDLASC